MPTTAPRTTIAGRYEVVAKIGEGGMGQVLRARDTKLDRDVALKLLPPRSIGDEKARERLVREARAAARLAHAGIVHVYDVGETDDGSAYIAMELVSGKTLRSLMAEGGAGVEELLRALAECARALAFAHREGAVHRDVKPDNIMIRTDGRAALLDFGIAKTLSADAAGLTDEGQVVGTPAYLAPEQARGEELDGRADQFALAVTAYEALTGRLPWQGLSSSAIIAAILRDDPAPPSEVRPELGRGLDAVLLRALAKSRANRYPSLDAFADALEDASAALGATAPMPASLRQTERLDSADARAPAKAPEPAPTKGARPRRAPAILGVLAACALAAFVVWRLAATHAPAAIAAADAGPNAMPTAVTDLPVPPSSSLEALAAYREGMQAERDGNSPVIARSFKRAIELDPTMASAYWRYADIIFADQQYAESREALNHALSQKTALPPRDRGVAETYEALLRSSPPDYAEWGRRLDALLVLYPLDAELYVLRAQATENDDAESERIARRAIDLDPHYGFAFALVIQSFERRGMRDEAARAQDECVRAAPGAAQCLWWRAARLARAGRCSEWEDVTSRLLRITPESGTVLEMRASGLARSGADPATLREALVAMGQHYTGGPSHGAVEAVDIYDAWTGDFADLLARAASRDAALAGVKQVGALAEATAFLSVAQHESGHDADAGKAARAFLQRRPLLEPGVTYGPRRDRSGVVLEAARATGVVSRAERDRLVAAWMTEWTKSAETHDIFCAWASLRAGPASTREDAEAALAAMPPDPQPWWREDVRPALANMYVLLERWDDAVPLLEAAVRECDVVDNVPWLVRAHVQLGDAYATKKDVAGACAQYRWVEDRWGGAKPRSVTAEAAVKKMRALDCGKPPFVGAPPPE